LVKLTACTGARLSNSPSPPEAKAKRGDACFCCYPASQIRYRFPHYGVLLERAEKNSRKVGNDLRIIAASAILHHHRKQATAHGGAAQMENQHYENPAREKFPKQPNIGLGTNSLVSAIEAGQQLQASCMAGQSSRSLEDLLKEQTHNDPFCRMKSFPSRALQLAAASMLFGAPLEAEPQDKKTAADDLRKCNMSEAKRAELRRRRKSKGKKKGGRR
jgi:hypothetical protein